MCWFCLCLYGNQASKHAESDCIWSRSVKWAWWFLHTDLLLGQICLAKTWHSQPEPNRTQAGFAQYDLGSLWNNATESESGKLGAGCLCSARIRPDDSCTPACFRTRCTWPKPAQAIQIGSGLVLYSMIRAFFEERNWIRCGKPDLAYTIQPDSGHNGHNQNASGLDPACLLGMYNLGYCLK